jgi:cytochrome o ubiquinol oxidase subunit II
MPARRKKIVTPTRIALGSVLLGVVLAGSLWLLVKDANIAVLNPQGMIASQQRDLIIFTSLLSVIVVVPVFTMLGLFAWKYREGNKRATYTPDEDGNRWLEALWWGIPIIIIGVLGVITWVTTHQLDPYKPITSTVAPLKVQVVALQWKWLFLYPEQGVASVGEMHIPVGTPVNFEITADAPMSAFWIPNLAGQIYAMNGMTSKLSLVADNPGTYRGSNTNINGEGYSKMYFDTIAMPSRNQFDSWAQITRERNDSMNLNMAAYEELAKPSDNKKPIHFKLQDVNLYAKIMDKYMSSHDDTMKANEHEGSGH